MSVGATISKVGAADSSPARQSSSSVTNISQIRGFASQNPDASYFISLEGNVWWADPVRGKLVLKDDSGAEALEMDFQKQPVQPRQRVRITGNGTIIKRGAAFQIGAKGPVVDNDGIHAMIEKSGAVYLKAGRHPLRVDWFNGSDNYGLTVEYTGPGLLRQSIPDSALFRVQVDAANGTSNWINGLDYRCCEVKGEALPDFSKLTALKTGTTKNFDLSLVTRAEHVGLEFTGFLEVAQDGLYKFYTKSDDGSRLSVGEPSLRVEVTGQSELPVPHPIAIGQTLRGNERNQWVQVEGKVTFARKESDRMQLELSGGAGRIRVEIADGSRLAVTNLLNDRIRAVGFCQGVFTTDGQLVPGILLVPGEKQIELIKAPESVANLSTNADALPLLTTAVEVHRLKRADAQRRHPVKIRGVVTSVLPEHQAFTFQDSTRGLYVIDFSSSLSVPPQIGEFLEVEGTTDPGLFAPVVNARQVTSMGAGHLPEPVHPTWDQLMSGSMDAQYVEVAGVITAVLADGVTLLTSGGIIKIELRANGVKLEELKQYENALVRVRGCLFACWDYVTHQVKLGEIKIYGADIFLDQSAPTDLFSTPGKTAAELRLFDPQAGVFQRVKVSGQIVFVREGECLMVQGGKGLRFIAKTPTMLEAGDLVEVVGFPDLLSNASPVLREALVRKTGHSALPAAKRLQPDDLIQAEHDSTQVRLEGLLVNIRATPTDQVLEMQNVQNGVRTFVARLNAKDASVQSLPIGSRLELTGVYAGLGGNHVTGQDIASFELLLHSAADIKVLARPPWWTLRKLFIIMGGLACVLAITVLWITQLHRKVEERTAELGAQIQERQHVEHQRALEQERSRVAQDLHDDLGAGLTEISILGQRARSLSTDEEKQSQYLEQIDDKARQMVTALDEIVWAMNPAQDSLSSLVSYFCLYADHFLGLAKISWHLEGANGLPDIPVNSLCRHELFLAFKEALTNIVRHSGATEVRLNIQLGGGQLRLSVADNGPGLPSVTPTAHKGGLVNMRVRIEKLGGRFECVGEKAQGTILRFFVPVDSIKRL